QYLRSRKDTVRCVVTNLTEEGPGDLAEELVRGGEASDPVDEQAAEMEDWQNWKPDPVDSDPMKTPKSGRTSDIISMLVNVYGSKELLSMIPFVDSQLHYCEVMLKDVYDSRRINAHLHSDPNFDHTKQPYTTNALILSAQFWPSFKELNSLELPDLVKERLAVYTKAFETLKDCCVRSRQTASYGRGEWSQVQMASVPEMVCEDEETESVMASAHDQREEELQVFWSYIVGMLTNLDSMPLERIHQMLKMFASQGPSSVECSLQELRLFLDRKVREHKLLFSGGFYRLPKS
ncbi:anaphase-promoting complex subunit 2-like, partial [Nilaparvata lugens]|uniref:anaphase-promoting complex subunit 2-like n=1 Tax=Nilaparvata lugens TaxID=108931 RepID=UPI00193CFA0C